MSASHIAENTAKYFENSTRQEHKDGEFYFANKAPTHHADEEG
jgi:hypothetical protein